MRYFLLFLFLMSGAVKAAPNEQNIEGAAFLMLFCPVCLVPESLNIKDEKIVKDDSNDTLVEDSKEIKSPQ